MRSNISSNAEGERARSAIPHEAAADEFACRPLRTAATTAKAGSRREDDNEALYVRFAWFGRACVRLRGCCWRRRRGLAADALRDKWCSKVHLRFFVGGAEGDAFGTIVYNGARQAAADTGAQVDYVFSGWANEKMTQQLREAVAAHPDGIAMMGHPGEAAILPLAEQAAKAGNQDDVPERAGAGRGRQGRRRLCRRAAGAAGPCARRRDAAPVRPEIRRPGDRDPGFQRRYPQCARRGDAKALEEGGVKVVRLASQPEWAADPNLAIPVVTAALQANPTAKAIVYPGGQQLGNAATYMKAAGKKPGEVINVGFDTSPQIVEAFKSGWVQLTADQQPFQQGYLPILSLCEQIVYGLAPINVDTGAGFVTPENYKAVADLAIEGLR